MIQQATPRLEEDRFDLIIIGGGVQGASMALEATVQGLRPLLLERDDFGGSTSGQVLRILHGGFRYLQTADLGRFRESLRARAWWMEAFPELVAPLPSLLPLYGRGLHRPGILQVALRADELLRRSLAPGPAAGTDLPPGHLLTREEVVDEIPDLPRTGLKGGAVWYDAWMVSPQRLIIEILRWACSQGAQALNYTEVTAVVASAGSVVGVEARDLYSGTESLYRAPVVVNCAGPWVDHVLGNSLGGRPPLFSPALSFNLLLDRPPPSARYAVALRAGSTRPRVHFLCPHQGALLAGTVHAPWEEGTPLPVEAPSHLVTRFLEDLNRALPSLALTEEAVLAHAVGLLPGRRAGDEVPRSGPTLVDHGALGGPEGLLTVCPAKFTTAPTLSRRVLDRIRPHAQPSAPSAPTSTRPSVRPWRSLSSFRRMTQEDPERTRTVLQELIQEEAVRNLEDLVLRRLDWALEPGGPSEGRLLLESLVDPPLPPGRDLR